jgi:general nucleoside transport system permease protein
VIVVRRLGSPTTIGILGVIALMAITMIVAGTNPIDGFAALLHGALGGRNEIGETLVATSALLFPSLGVCLAFRAGLFNIGAEGQLLIGALAAGAVGASIALPPVVQIPLLLLLGAFAGGVWGAIAGWMKARFSANEIISTLMLNFVAAYVSLDLVNGPLRGPLATGAETAWLAPGYWLPILIPHTRLSAGILLGLALAFALRWVFQRTVFGFDVGALGAAPEAARRSGIDVARLTWVVLACSGAICGLGGATIVTGELHRFNTELSPGYGFTAIAVALVGDLDPLWICLAAFAFGILESGGLAMQASAQVPKDAIGVIEGLVVFALAARRYITTRREPVPA